MVVCGMRVELHVAHQRPADHVAVGVAEVLVGVHDLLAGAAEALDDERRRACVPRCGGELEVVATAARHRVHRPGRQRDEVGERVRVGVGHVGCGGQGALRGRRPGGATAHALSEAEAPTAVLDRRREDELGVRIRDLEQIDVAPRDPDRDRERALRRRRIIGASNSLPKAWVAQPLSMPQTIPFEKGEKAPHEVGYRGRSGPVSSTRWRSQLFGQKLKRPPPAHTPCEFLTVTCTKPESPNQPSRTSSGRSRRPCRSAGSTWSIPIGES